MRVHSEFLLVFQSGNFKENYILLCSTVTKLENKIEYIIKTIAFSAECYFNYKPSYYL